MVPAMPRGETTPSLAPMHALFVTYALRGTTPAQHAELCEQLAPAVAAVPGLVSKTWLANGDTGRYGGFYVFASRPDCDHFIASELFDVLRSHGTMRDVEAHEFSIATGPTATTRGASQPDPGRSS
jgi:Putative mono-oxygenase ydhR